DQKMFKVTDRIYMESRRNKDYQANFPKISSNFDRPVHRGLTEKNDPPSGNTNNFPKKDQIPKPAPYTVIQTYADRLRYNQAKRGVSIKLTEPEITTKQGLPVVLYVKDEVVKDLASTCKFTLIGKFIYAMPRVELIRKNFILQTQLSRGAMIAHFNSRHVYIDLDNELDYNMVWTKQRMTIAGQIMRIQAWTITFKPDEETLVVRIWISLPELPWHRYNKEFITSLLSPIGRVLYLDSASINKTRGSKARVKVQVDLTKDRPPHIWMSYIC
ncbi:hypothetical protein EJD97_025000, partial [Solanum chilense]